MIHLKVAAFTAGLAIAVSSVAIALAADPVAAPPPGKGQVVFFRDNALKASAFAYSIRQDGKVVGTVGRGKYMVLVTEPGLHEYTVQSEVKDALRLEVEPDETYYVRQTMDIGMLITTARLTPSDQKTFESIGPKPIQPKAAD